MLTAVSQGGCTGTYSRATPMQMDAGLSPICIDHHEELIY